MNDYFPHMTWSESVVRDKWPFDIKQKLVPSKGIELKTFGLQILSST